MPQPTAVSENKSAAEALRAEMGFANSGLATNSPISAKAALKRKIAVMEENDSVDTDSSSPAIPIVMPKTASCVAEDVQDTVR